MKTRKWLWWTLGILAALALLAGAGLTGYRIGVMHAAQSSDNPHAFMFSHMDRFDDMHGHPGFDGGKPQFHQGNRFDSPRRGFSHGGGFSIFPAFFGLIRLAFWALVIWAAYTLFTRSGWRLVRENPPAVEVVEEKKPRRAKKSS